MLQCVGTQESMMPAIRSGVTRFIAIHTKLKFLTKEHHEVRQTQLHLGLKK